MFLPAKTNKADGLPYDGHCHVILLKADIEIKLNVEDGVEVLERVAALFSLRRYEHHKLSKVQSTLQTREAHSFRKVCEAELTRAFLKPREELGNITDVGPSLHQL